MYELLWICFGEFSSSKAWHTLNCEAHVLNSPLPHLRKQLITTMYDWKHYFQRSIHTINHCSCELWGGGAWSISHGMSSTHDYVYLSSFVNELVFMHSAPDFWWREHFRRQWRKLKLGLSNFEINWKGLLSRISWYDIDITVISLADNTNWYEVTTKIDTQKWIFDQFQDSWSVSNIPYVA